MKKSTATILVALIVILVLVVFYLLWMRSKPTTNISTTTPTAQNPIEVSFNEFLTSLQGLATAIRNNNNLNEQTNP